MTPYRDRATSAAKHRAAARRRKGAFTAVEVLISMTIMAIGAAAVMTMQKASIQGNLDARKADVANSIARMWVERLRRDAMQWTLVPGNGATNVITSASATLLGQNVGQWGFPDADMGGTVPTMSYAFDILGRDLAQADITGVTNGIPASPVFCVNVFLTTLTQTLVRADVRVLWPRGITTMPPNFCSAIDPQIQSGALATSILYHALYVTTALTVNASQPQ